MQGERAPPAHKAGDAQSLPSTNGSCDPEKRVKTTKITQQVVKRDNKTPENNKQQGGFGQQETPTNPPTRNLTRTFQLKLKQPRIQYTPTTELQKTTDWLDKTNKDGIVTSNKKTDKTTTTAKIKLPDNQTTTTTDNKIPEKQNKAEIPEDNVPRLTVKLRQPQLQFGNKTTTKTTPTDNKRKLKNDNKPAKEKTINTKVTKIKKQPSIEGYITTNRSKNNGQENTGTTTITTNNTKETTGHPQPTTNQGNKQHNQTVKAKSDITRKPTPKQRLKPPDIDKLTPVYLKIKVRGTVVSDIK